MRIPGGLVVLWIFVNVIVGGTVLCQKQKRQLFREQVLPARGGKIPDDAFRTDRLALNRLNKEGITLADGVILQARHNDKHPTHVRSQPEVVKVYATTDNRYTPPEGRYHYSEPQTLDTTYVIRKPVASHIGKPSNFKESSPRKHHPNKPHGYTNFIRYSNPQNVHQHYIYKPALRPFHLPANEISYSGYYNPSWSFPIEWSTFRPIDSFYFDNTAFETQHLFDNYEFYEDFHQRSIRHTDKQLQNH